MTVPINSPQIELRVNIPLFCRFTEPFRSLCIVVLRNAYAIIIHQPQIILSLSKPLLSCNMIPFKSLFNVGVDTFATITLIHSSQFILCIRIPYLSCFLVPLGSLCIVLRNAFTFKILLAQFILSLAIFLIRGLISLLALIGMIILQVIIRRFLYFALLTYCTGIEKKNKKQ